MTRRLNLPILDELKNIQNVMIVGVGGGFDVFGGLPIIYDAPTHLRFTLVAGMASKDFVWRETSEKDYPEWGLAPMVAFLPFVRGVYTVGRHGVQTLAKGLMEIAEREQIEAVIAIDGGVDALMRGDEENPGTYVEDFIMLAALRQLGVKVSILASTGFGAELEEDVDHHSALRNMAALARDGHFLGSCAMTPDMDSFKWYEKVCRGVMELGRKSHVQPRVIGSVNGEFGDYRMYEDIDAKIAGCEKSVPCFCSPLMSLYWFYDLRGVVERNLMIPALQPSSTFTDALILGRNWRDAHGPRIQKQAIPL